MGDGSRFRWIEHIHGFAELVLQPAVRRPPPRRIVHEPDERGWNFG
jgi:hypothetical protein